MGAPLPLHFPSKPLPQMVNAPHCVSQERSDLVTLRLLRHYYPIVSSTVRRIERKLPLHAYRDELHGAAMLGLVHALQRYEQSPQSSFQRYVRLRVRGAVMDELRRQDNLPRTARRKARQHNETQSNLRQELGREPQAHEIRLRMGLSDAQYTRLKRDTEPVHCTSLEATETPSRSENKLLLKETLSDTRSLPANAKMEKHEMLACLREKLDSLPPRQRYIVEQYYYNERKLVDIAREWKVSEARICQLHTKALKYLREHIEKDL